MIGIFLAFCHLFFNITRIFRLWKKGSITSSAITADGIGDLINSDAASVASSTDGSISGAKTTTTAGVAADERSLSCKSVGKHQSVVGIRKIRSPEWPAAPQLDICLTDDYGPIPWREAVTERAASVPALLGFGAVPGGFPGIPQSIPGYGMGMNGFPHMGMGMNNMPPANFPVAARFVNPTPPMIGYPIQGGGMDPMGGYAPQATGFSPQNMFNPMQNGAGRQNVYCSGPGNFVYPRPLPSPPPINGVNGAGGTNGMQECQHSHHSSHVGSKSGKSSGRTTNASSCQPSNSHVRNGGSRHTRINAEHEEEITGELPSFTRSRRTRAAAKSASLIPAHKCGKAIGFEDTLTTRGAAKNRHATVSQQRSIKSPSTVDSRRRDHPTDLVPVNAYAKNGANNNRVRACSNGTSQHSGATHQNGGVMQRNGSPTTSRGTSFGTGAKLETRSTTAAPPCIRSALHHSAAYPQPYPQMQMHSGFTPPSMGVYGSNGAAMGASQFHTAMNAQYGMQQMAPQASAQPYPPIPLGPGSQSHVQWANCTNFDEGFDPSAANLPRRPAAM